MVHAREICQKEETKKESKKTIIDVLMKAARSYDFFPEQRYVDFIKTISTLEIQQGLYDLRYILFCLVLMSFVCLVDLEQKQLSFDLLFLQNSE